MNTKKIYDALSVEQRISLMNTMPLELAQKKVEGKNVDADLAELLRIRDAGLDHESAAHREAFAAYCRKRAGEVKALEELERICHEGLAVEFQIERVRHLACKLGKGKEAEPAIATLNEELRRRLAALQGWIDRFGRERYHNEVEREDATGFYTRYAAYGFFMSTFYEFVDYHLNSHRPAPNKDEMCKNI